MKLKHFSAFLLAASVALGACNDGGTDPDDLDSGTFEGQVVGDIDVDLNGEAESLSTVNSSSGQDIIHLVDFTRQVEIIAGHIDAFFSEGSEQLIDFTNPTVDEGVGAFVYFGTTDQLFYATNGVIDLDDVSSAGITGTLEFDAVEVDQQTEQILDDEVTIEVAFSTEYGGAFNRVPLGEAGPLGNARIQKIRVR